MQDAVQRPLGPDLHAREIGQRRRAILVVEHPPVLGRVGDLDRPAAPQDAELQTVMGPALRVALGDPRQLAARRDGRLGLGSRDLGQVADARHGCRQELPLGRARLLASQQLHRLFALAAVRQNLEQPHRPLVYRTGLAQTLQQPAEVDFATQGRRRSARRQPADRDRDFEQFVQRTAVAAGRFGGQGGHGGDGDDEQRDAKKTAGNRTHRVGLLVKREVSCQIRSV